MNLNLNKDNVKVGDILYVVPTDSRQRIWNFEVAKIGKKYISDKYNAKIEIDTHEIYRKDGVGSTEYVYLSKDDYEKAKVYKNKRGSFANKMYNSSSMCYKMSDEDIETITKIMCKYDEKWLTR